MYNSKTRFSNSKMAMNIVNNRKIYKKVTSTTKNILRQNKYFNKIQNEITSPKPICNTCNWT